MLFIGGAIFATVVMPKDIAEEKSGLTRRLTLEAQDEFGERGNGSTSSWGMSRSSSGRFRV